PPRRRAPRYCSDGTPKTRRHLARPDASVAFLDALRDELRCASASGRNARAALLAASDRRADAARRDGALARRDDGAVAARAGVVGPRGTRVPLPPSRPAPT